MKLLGLLAAAVGLSACGPPPMDVSGGWGGLHTLTVTGSETASGHVGTTVIQNGGDLSFPLDGCNLTAKATGETTFGVEDFECTRMVNTRSWTLYGKDGSITTSATSFKVSITGDATSGDQASSFTWEFNGTRL